MEIPSIKFTYVLAEVETEEEGWLLVADKYGEAIDSVNVTFE